MGGKLPVGYHHAAGSHIILSFSQTFHEMLRHIIFLARLSIDVPHLGLLAEQESHARHSVSERESAHCDGIVLIDNSFAGTYNIEFQLIRTLSAEELEQPAKLLGSFFKDVNRHCATLALQCHRR